MSERNLPVHPNLDQLKHQAKDLLRETRKNDASAKLSSAQYVLARSYGVQSWPRLALACRMVDAIWQDDVEAVRTLVLKHPRLLHEMARGTEHCNWGPPMSYAANLGRDRIIEMLRDLGAKDLTRALARAVLQGQIETARRLYAMGARPPRGTLMGPAEAQNIRGMTYALELGAEICDDNGNLLAPVAMLLETYSRNAKGKHECLELLAAHGVELPDTPTMALHRGRIDLLEEHLLRDPQLLSRIFSHREIYPPELGCHTEERLALCGTPVIGTTLLHMAVDYNELEIVRWLIDRGMDVNAKADVDAEGFGGHTALFGSVVAIMHLSQKYSKLVDAPFARLLLDHGADPGARASLRKQLVGSDDDSMHEYRDVTPLSWGRRFHDQGFVSQPALKLIEERGGHE